MPPHAAASPIIRQMYINGHLCYAFKFGIITNGLGIVRDIAFYNKYFLKAHPEILADSRAQIPKLRDFFRKHLLIRPETFLRDAAFDSIEIYKYLL